MRLAAFECLRSTVVVPAQLVQDQLGQWFLLTPYQICLAFARSIREGFALDLRVPLNNENFGMRQKYMAR